MSGLRQWLDARTAELSREFERMRAEQASRESGKAIVVRSHELERAELGAWDRVGLEVVSVQRVAARLGFAAPCANIYELRSWLRGFGIRAGLCARAA